MTKDSFIQQCLIRGLPSQDKFAGALAHAEWLWAQLSKAGYGEAPKGEAKPRKSRDWYNDLDARQKRYFDAFWLAFNYKNGRNEAAQAWHELGVMTNDQYQEIIDAAAFEAKRDRPDGQARMYAQGWLNRKRFSDHKPTQKQHQNAADLVVRRLKAEREGVWQLYQRTQNPALKAQIDKLDEAIKAADKPAGVQA